MNQVPMDYVEDVLVRACRCYLGPLPPLGERRDRLMAAVEHLVSLLDGPGDDDFIDLKVRTACRTVLLTLNG